MTPRRPLLLALPLLLARSQAARAGAGDTPKSVRVTYVSAPFNVPANVMRANGYLTEAFATQGITVESPVIISGAAQVQAIAAGAIDIASVLGDASAILGRANGVDLKVVAAFSRSPRAFVIMARADGPASIAALKGRRVAGPKGTALQQLLAAALLTNGLRLADVEYLNMDLAASRAALLAGHIDAATLAGNDALAVEAAGGRVVASGEGLIAPTLVIAVRGAFLREQPDLVRTYLAAQRRALDFMQAEPNRALAIAAAAQKITLAEARRMRPWYDFSPAITDQDVRNMAATQAFMVQAGMLQKTIDIRTDLIDPSAFSAP
jgi:sulfonate transport system substrate-binding protein